MYGYNANDNETTQAILEELLRRHVSPDVEVLSLGVASYSGVRYAILARLYFEFLKPDVVIVAVDESDFEEDVVRINDYILDASGYPLILKAYKELEDNRTPQQVVFDSDRTMIVSGVAQDWKTALRAGSSLINAAVELKQYLTKPSILAPNPAEFKILTDEEVTNKYCTTPRTPSHDRRITSEVTLDYFCLDLPTLVGKYSPTLKSLKYVKIKADEVGARMYLSSYPYPWSVQLNRSLSRQAVEPIQKAEKNQKVQLDFRKFRTHPDLLDRFALDLNVTHLNAYPIFEDDNVNYWGDFDPHFNASGYRRYATFLFDSTKSDVEQAVLRIAR